MDYGGPIPTAELTSEINIEMVLRLELVDCLDIFHSCLESTLFGLHRSQKSQLEKFRQRNKETSPLTREERQLYSWLRSRMKINQTELLLRLQKEAYEMSIPRHHSGGLLLVWLRLCMGYDI